MFRTTLTKILSFPKKWMHKLDSWKLARGVGMGYLRGREIDWLLLFVFLGAKIWIQNHSEHGNQYSNDVSWCERIMQQCKAKTKNKARFEMSKHLICNRWSLPYHQKCAKIHRNGNQARKDDESLPKKNPQFCSSESVNCRYINP